VPIKVALGAAQNTMEEKRLLWDAENMRVNPSTFDAANKYV